MAPCLPGPNLRLSRCKPGVGTRKCVFLGVILRRMRSMRFDLVDLKLFCDVVEAGTITRGAERSALALAAASTRLKAMEDVVGAPLLTRSRAGVTLTPAGKTLLDHARLILKQSARMREDLGVYAGGSAGHVRVLANTNASTEFLPEALSAFLASHPRVTVDLEE